jgi:hypothetical protein
VATYYLLPCTCGEKVTVERSQAGQLVQCRCGASLEVPTFAGLSRLSQAAPTHSARPTAGTWGGRQRVLLVGGILLVAAGALATCLVISWPVIPTELSTAEQIERIEQRAKVLSPVESWVTWEAFHATTLDPRRPKPDPRLEEAIQWYRAWLGVASVLALCGAALALAAWLVRSAPAVQQVDNASPRPNQP